MADAKKNKTKNTKEPMKASAATKNKVKPTKEDLRSKKLDAIKQKLERQRQEEERLRKEAEEEERRFQEEQRRLEEQRRIEAEKREHKKQKDKERRQRLKEEGKLLSEKEKENRRRAMELAQSRGLDLESMRANAKNRAYTRLKKRPFAQSETPTPMEDPTPVETSPPEEEKSETPEEKDSDGDKGWEDLAAELNEIEKEADDKPSVSDEEEVLVDVAEGEPPLSPTISELQEVTDQSASLKLSDAQLTEEEKRGLIEEAKARIASQHEKVETTTTERVLRSGVICVMGHVDTGKTKILDKLRNTNVQNREAGGITQQIGATNVPRQNIIHATRMCDFFKPEDLKMPGLLIIDTPGHESFSNMRIRGSSLCDFAILVVDIMHGIEEQTKESIEILLNRRTPFVVALNKIDRLYQWESYPDLPVEEALSKQKDVTTNDFNARFKAVSFHFDRFSLS